MTYSYLLLFAFGLIVLLPILLVATARLQECVDRWYVARTLERELDRDFEANVQAMVAAAFGEAAQGRMWMEPSEEVPERSPRTIARSVGRPTPGRGDGTVLQVPVYRYDAQGDCSLETWSVYLN